MKAQVALACGTQAMRYKAVET